MRSYRGFLARPRSRSRRPVTPRERIAADYGTFKYRGNLHHHSQGVVVEKIAARSTGPTPDDCPG